MALTDFLTQIANAIRSKDGTTEPIVATDFPQRILDIPSGSGDGSNDVKVATGTIILSEDRRIVWSQYASQYMEIEHGLGVVPNFAFMYDADFTTRDNYPAYTGAFIKITDVGLEPHRSAAIDRTYNATGGVATDIIYNSDPEKEGKRYTDTVYRFGHGNACNLIAGRTYKWVIGRV